MGIVWESRNGISWGMGVDLDKKGAVKDERYACGSSEV